MLPLLATTVLQGRRNAQGFPSVNDFLIASSRTYLPTVAPLTTARWVGGCRLEKSPPWDTTAQSLGFCGFYGLTSFGETALSNNYLVEGAGIEVNGTKYWFSFDGSNQFTSTTPSAGDPVYSAIVDAGSFRWTDPVPLMIPANSDVRLIWACDSLVAGNQLPNGGSSIPFPLTFAQTAGGRGDFFVSNTGTSRLATIAANTTAGVATTFGTWAGSPCAWVAKPASVAAAATAKATGAVLCVGMSIDAGANDFNGLFGATASDGLNFGGQMRGLYRGSRRIPAVNWSIPGTRTGDLLNNQTPGTGVRGWDRREAMMAARGYPWTTVIIGGPVNNPTTGQAYTDDLVAAATAFKARGNRRVVFTTERPNSALADQATGTANGFLLTGGDSRQRVTGTIKQDKNARILAAPSPIDAVIDLRPATDSGRAIGAAETAKWRSDGPATTFAAGAASGQRVFVVTSNVILPGDHVALSPKAATGSSERIYADTVVDNGNGTWSITAKSNLTFSYTTGEPVQVLYGETADRVHTARLGSVAEAELIDAAKGSAIL